MQIESADWQLPAPPQAQKDYPPGRARGCAGVRCGVMTAGPGLGVGDEACAGLGVVRTCWRGARQMAVWVNQRGNSDSSPSRHERRAPAQPSHSDWRETRRDWP